MQFRVQTGKVVDGKWVPGPYDQLFDAADLAEAQSKAPMHAMTGTWHENGEWLRVIGPNGQEHRWPPKETT